ncbi:phage neck terminator protein [Brevibacillus centrosporus]|uniref:phage neck terminator protein n=1 Tax=Brevibacillus centrosporus TaxID=54910 RepID=UPI00398804C6
MVPFKAIRSAIVQELAAFLSVPVIEMNGGGEMPEQSFFTYDFTDFEDASGFPCEYLEGDILRHEGTVSFTVSFLSFAENKATSVENALLARDWLKREGRDLLKDRVNVIVSEIGTIENRDVLLADEWERRQGFEVTFRTLDVTEREFIAIERANVKGVEGFGG